jgi:hypothetical protein
MSFHPFAGISDGDSASRPRPSSVGPAPEASRRLTLRGSFRFDGCQSLHQKSSGQQTERCGGSTRWVCHLDQEEVLAPLVLQAGVITAAVWKFHRRLSARWIGESKSDVG